MAYQPPQYQYGGAYPPPLPPTQQQQDQQQSTPTDPSSSAQPPPSSAAGQGQGGPGVRPLRAMLARGAACDTCRARKVKCDALRPFCSPCLKSARGDTSLAQSKCKYEGTSVAAAREQAAQAARESGATVGVGMGGKRKRASNANGGGNAGGAGGGGKKVQREAKREVMHQQQGREEEEEDEEELDALVRGEKRGRFASAAAATHDHGSASLYSNLGPLPLPPHLQHQQQQQHPGYPPHQQQQLQHPTYPSPNSAYYGAPPPAPPPSQQQPGGVVEELTGRVAQLERQLQQQADAHAAQLSSASASSAAPPPPPPQQQQYSNPYSNQHHSHTRSPSFPYSATPAYPPPPPPPPAHGAGQYQLPPLSASLSNGGLSLNPPSSSAGYDSQQGFPPPRTAGGSLLPPLSAGGGGAERAGGAGGMFAYPTPSLSASSSATSSSAAAPPHTSFLPPSSSYPSAASGFSPRPLSTGGARTPLPSLSALASAAGAAGGEFGFPTAASWSPGSGVAESNLRGGGAAPVAVASPMSGLRRLVASADGEAEGQGGERAGVVESPRGSLWGITGNGAAKGYTVVDTSASSSSYNSHSHSHSYPASSSAPASNGVGSTTTTPPAAASGFDAAGDQQRALLPSSFTSHHPSSYPPTRTLLLLLHAFFARATLPSSMLDRAHILACVELGFAGLSGLDEGLVHAMCAYGAFYVSSEALESSASGGEGDALGLGLALDGQEGQEGEGDEGQGEGRRRKGKAAPYWMREGDGSAMRYHYRRAKRSVELATLGGGGGGEGGRGRDLFQVLQSTILLCYTAYLTCSFTDLWLLSGTATRLCTPLGLSHLDPWDFERMKCGPAGEDWGVRVRWVERRDLMKSPQTLDEHWRRSVTFWLAFAVDRWASASTDWSTSIDEKDISTHLPCAAPMMMPSLTIDRRTGQIPSLSISSPSFLTDMSAPIGPLGLYIKATVLLGRVVNYLQRLPRARCVDVGGTCAEVKATLKNTPEFIELDVALSKFKASHSATFYDATGSSIDGFRTSAYVIPHVATILLHEAFTDRLDQSSTSSNARCLVAAKCVVNSMFVLYQSSYDLGGCDPFLPFCWSTTGRALVRDYATRRLWPNTETNNYTEEAEASKALAEHCLSFMRECGGKGSSIAAAQADALQKHLDDPDALLPFDGSEPWAVSAYLEPI